MPSVQSGRSGGRCEVRNCDKNSRYECPRCAIAYCSLACYRNHSTSCVASFDADAVESRQRFRASESESRRMRHFLAELNGKDYLGHEDDHNFEYVKKSAVHQAAGESDCKVGEDFVEWNETDSESDSDFEGDDGDETGGSLSSSAGSCGNPEGGSHDDATSDCEADMLEDILQGMNELGLSYEDALSRLPAEMAQDFQNRLNDGRISRVLPLWQPWWIPTTASEGRNSDNRGEDCVENDELKYRTDNYDETDADTEPSHLPREPTDSDYTVPISLVKRKASPHVLFSVIDALMSYCIVERLCNGDMASCPEVAAGRLWSASGVLANDARHACTWDAVSSVCQRQQHLPSREAQNQAGLDTCAVLRLPGGAARAILQVQMLLAKTARDPRSRKSAKKTGFLLSYVAGVDQIRLDLAADEVEEWVRSRCGDNPDCTDVDDSQAFALRPDQSITTK